MTAMVAATETMTTAEAVVPVVSATKRQPDEWCKAVAIPVTAMAPELAMMAMMASVVMSPEADIGDLAFRSRCDRIAGAGSARERSCSSGQRQKP